MAQTLAQTQTHWQYTATPAMDDVQYRQWVDLLESRAGIALPASRKTFLVTNLHIRMRELEIADYQSYYGLVTDGSRGQVEWEILVDKLTVHETRFFRDNNALDLIRKHYLQRLLAQERSQPYTVHVWSVGCATGEEPYSLAMLMEHMFGDNSNLYYGVTGSDISRAALQAGRNAVYHSRRVKNVSQEIATKFLLPVDAEHVQVVPQLRHKVCFNHLNLLELETQPLGEMDIIICQNVLIYFKHELRNRILAQLATRLKPNGLLVLGAGEAFSWSHPLLQTVKHESTQAYRRLPATGAD